MLSRLSKALLLAITGVLPFFSAAQPTLLSERGISKGEAVLIAKPPAPYKILEGSPVILKHHPDAPGLNKPIYSQGQIESASSANCPDSSYIKIFETTTDRNYAFQCSAKTSDGGILVAGFGRDRSVTPLTPWYGIITKMDSLGNHAWSREIRSDVTSALVILGLKELNDGSIIITGAHHNSIYYVPPTEYQDFFVSKLTATGDLIWLKTFHSRLVLNCSSGNIYGASVAEGLNGDLLIGGTIKNCPSPAYLLVFKLNSTGDLQWENAYRDQFSSNHVGGILYEAGSVTVINRGSNVGSGGDNVIYVNLLRFNYSTGALMSYKSWKPDLTYPASFNYGFTNNLYTTRLSNGNICIYGQVFGAYNFTPNTITPHYAVLEFDGNHDFLNGYTINTSVLGNSNVTSINVDKSKKVLYSVYSPIVYPDADLYIGSGENGRIYNQRKWEFRNRENGYAHLQHLNDGSFISVRNLATVGQSNFYLEFARLHNSDTSDNCIGLRSEFSSMVPIHYIPYSFTWVENPSNPIEETNNRLNNSIPYSYIPLSNCFQKPSCDTVKIHGTAISCDVNQDFIFTAFKNPECGARVNWFMNQAPVLYQQILNDTTVSIRFSQPWQGWLYAELNSTCGLLKDSVWISMMNSPGAVNLGPDLELCPNNTVTLNAHSGYASYLWNTGSPDSVLIVTIPGTYYVDVTDSCGNFYSDTVIVSASAPIPLSVGPDRIKCNNDTVQLAAPGGFLNYYWEPPYNISSQTSRQVIVQPDVDTTYFVRAELTPGCFAYDTIHISVHRSPFINLGQDTSFCRGDSMELDAGTGFAFYSWSTGAVLPRINVTDPGEYFVIAIDTNGCRSADTLRVLNVWSKPVVQLDKDSILCAGSSRALNAGSFESYLWQDGSQLPVYTATGTGTYHVIVTDQHSCIGSDTTRITSLKPQPSGFLPADTVICNYGNLVLRPTAGFNSYLWSNGMNTASVTVLQPGTYWLQVTDSNRCQGRDTINVNLKDCVKGFYMPTGFTPDNNGRNDYIRPVIGGRLIHYNFTIYNRWGRVVFSSREQTKGWDGKLAGVPQDGNVYIWTCTYQLEGEPLRNEKGTFVLIR